jgi:hypothetical protein
MKTFLFYVLMVLASAIATLCVLDSMCSVAATLTHFDFSISVVAVPYTHMLIGIPVVGVPYTHVPISIPVVPVAYTPVLMGLAYLFYRLTRWSMRKIDERATQATIRQSIRQVDAQEVATPEPTAGQ